MMEAKRRRLVYWGDRRRPELKDKVAILVDDGVATGMTFLAAVKELKHREPKRIVAALPVMPLEFEAELKTVVDEVVCLRVETDYLGSVGAYYASFEQVEDAEVMALLKAGK